jgi:DNA-directed RNA polymerase subunit M/transcription elongation factor TFIIS
MILCTNCSTPMETDQDNDYARVVCPSCKRDAGSWGEVKKAIFAKAEKVARDSFDDR